MQFNSPYQSQQGGIGSPKFSLQRPKPIFDKTLPSAPLKHYSSNPNLSLEMNAAKYPEPGSPTYDLPQKDFTMANQRPHINQHRHGRSDLAKSLIIGMS